MKELLLILQCSRIGVSVSDGLLTVVMLTKERHGKLEKVDRKNIHIQVTETRYK